METCENDSLKILDYFQCSTCTTRLQLKSFFSRFIPILTTITCTLCGVLLPGNEFPVEESSDALPIDTGLGDEQTNNENVTIKNQRVL